MEENGMNDGTRITSVGDGPTPQWPAAEAMAGAANTTSAGAAVAPSLFSAGFSVGIPHAVVDKIWARSKQAQPNIPDDVIRSLIFIADLVGAKALVDVTKIIDEEFENEGLGTGNADGISEDELLLLVPKL
ncbi:uncharacterized protein SPPG_08648 [Spizellomyces punctatus DAOM BR117]|uniref:Uncharacterized protein n=1 Tax=Spizellomyces punctatus (strain DAOM BR117) TaxID=645134 RepID=A0A0L0H502_SPIPD|nr:uncharacterized protein SPPG_08648 [Spizellomyces punctatus DAOM BR117]KNC96054.1 hypothetical protein SPPG_08648 [Spizellomyces punctatus DAOM BR117]|eukprot:XP_016604094.1 hypothetical protein SPPG_08648 [Spizellomyces punctatus DAOM BR117]